MQERYDFPKRRPATRTRKRLRLEKTSPCACRRVSGSADFTGMCSRIAAFETPPPCMHFHDFLGRPFVYRSPDPEAGRRRFLMQLPSRELKKLAGTRTHYSKAKLVDIILQG